jgi:S1-C subfamily serine protease
MLYKFGQGVPQDYQQAAHWYRLAAEQGDADEQYEVGHLYYTGQGVPQDYRQSAYWWRLAAEQGHANARTNLGVLYYIGRGVLQDYEQAARWWHLAAGQASGEAQSRLGHLYENGQGVPKDFVQAHMWFNLAAAQGDGPALESRDRLAKLMTPAQRAEAQRLAREWKPGGSKEGSTAAPEKAPTRPDHQQQKARFGTGFIVSRRGHVLTAAHVVAGCQRIQVRRPGESGVVATAHARSDRDDLAILIAPLPGSPAAFRTLANVRPGESVLTYGFPLAGALASAGNVTTGTVTALAGLRDDPGHLQISAPVQPGNSGGPLLDSRGLVVGVVVSKLDALKAAKTTGDIPQNVNFAIKGSLALNFLEAHGVPYSSAAGGKDQSPADIADAARAFTVRVECWE